MRFILILDYKQQNKKIGTVNLFNIVTSFFKY